MLAKKYKLNLDDKFNRKVFASSRTEGQYLRVYFRERAPETTEPFLYRVKGLRAAVVIPKKLVTKAAWRNQIRRAVYNQLSLCCLCQKDVDLLIQLKEKLSAKPTKQQIAHIRQETENLLIQIKTNNTNEPTCNPHGFLNRDKTSDKMLSVS